MRTLIFDTETNGKRPKVRRGQHVDPSEEPAVVQVAACLFEDRRPVGHLSCFINPIDHLGNPAAIPTEQFFIDSGITQERVDAVGLPNKAGIAMFYNFAKVCDRVVAHNIQFDDPIIRAAFKRAGVPEDLYVDKPRQCTMMTLEPVLKLPGRYGYKWPTLDEAYRALVDPEGFDGAHDAMVDVQACASVLWQIEDRIADGEERFNNCKMWEL